MVISSGAEVSVKLVKSCERANRKMVSHVRILIVLNLLVLSGCTLFKEPVPPVKEPAVAEVRHPLERLSPSAYPAFTDDMNYEGLDKSIKMSLAYLGRVPGDRVFVFGADSYSALHMIRSMEYFQKIIQSRPSSELIREMIRKDFLVYRSSGEEASGKVLYTGYYEPIIKGSLKETHEYGCPIYSKPNDLVTINLSEFSANYPNDVLIGRYAGQRVVPYYDRKTIENREIFKKPALAWVKDPVDVFFLHIQGSGKIVLDNGRVLNVNYHVTNGHPYRSIGRLLIDQGKIPRSEISMQSIRSYLKKNPQETEDVLNYNPSYVFFKFENDGPLGSLNVPLTPGRSIAVDRKIFPQSALMYIKAQKPVLTEDGQLSKWEEFERFALNQDTGGAITGPGRADIFWGNGAYAELAAGHLQHRGEMYFMVLRP